MRLSQDPFSHSISISVIYQQVTSVLAFSFMLLFEVLALAPVATYCI